MNIVILEKFFFFFQWTYFFISLEQIPRRGISGLQGRCIFSFIKKIKIKTCQSVSRVVIQFNLTLTNTGGILVVLYLPAFGVVSLLNFSHSGGRSVASHCSLKLSFPDDYDITYFFLCLLAMYIVIFLCEVSVQVFCPFLLLFCPFVIELEFLYILDRSFFRYIYCKYFSQSIACLFIF